MRTTVSCGGAPADLTLREALHKLGRGGSERSQAGGVGGRRRSGVAGEGAGAVRWEDVEGLLFDPYDPAKIMANPPSTVSVSSTTSADGAQEEEVRVVPRSEKAVKMPLHFHGSTANTAFGDTGVRRESINWEAYISSSTRHWYAM